jgi:hypothetical protein
MVPSKRTYVWSAVAAIALAGVWLVVRLFWVTELFGNVAPTFLECLIVFPFPKPITTRW